MDARRPTREAGVTARRRLLLAGWLLTCVGIVGRSVELQVVEGPAWQAVAARQHRKTIELPAPRGRILDRDGNPLALSHETVRVSVAPGEVRDPEAVAALLSETLDVPLRALRDDVTSGRRWVVLPGTYPPAVRERLAGVRGVYLETELQRVYPHGDLARSILGSVRDGEGAGGVEQAFDTVLRGRPGRVILARDSEGREIPGESYMVEASRAGNDLVLTIDLALQEIAHEALEDAISSTGARGGDLLITDPATGEILAMASLRDGRPTLSAVNTPYEPGSTLKPFTVAALLGEGLASLEDSVDTGDGSWTVAGRTVRDVHPHGRMTLGDALRVSSNVGIARFATDLPAADQYQALRDFGFGAPTGVELPGEAAGTLRRPSEWSRQSPVSLAIGYEIAVTPIQMAMAYGALANGGRLMEARLTREEPRTLRRVVREDVADAIGRVLVEVVEDGTGTAARLGNAFRVAGKSGTSRAYGEDGYERGSYFASFAGFFPADAPQLVVFVKLERPQGAYYGGAAAAPVTRATLEAILAARRPPLDRGALVQAASAAPPRSAFLSASFASRSVPPVLEGSARAPRVGDVPVPDVRGLSPRVAARRLHALGLRVAVEGGGPVGATVPAAGSRLAPGDTVRLRAGVAPDRWEPSVRVHARAAPGALPRAGDDDD